MILYGEDSLEGGASYVSVSRWRNVRFLSVAYR